MKTRKQILEEIKSLQPELNRAEEAYYSTIEAKQRGESVSQVDFLKIESEYELINKQVETLKWVININGEPKEDEDSESNKKGLGRESSSTL